MYVPIVPSSCKKKSIYPFFSVKKKNPKQNKRIFRENKIQEKRQRERELHLLKKME